MDKQSKTKDSKTTSNSKTTLLPPYLHVCTMFDRPSKTEEALQTLSAMATTAVSFFKPKNPTVCNTPERTAEMAKDQLNRFNPFQ